MFLEILLILLAIFLAFKWLFLDTKPDGTPPGLIGLPIIGTFPSGKESFETFINNCRKKFGDIFWLKIGSVNHVFLCNLEDIKDAFQNPSLQGRPKNFSMQQFYKYGNKDTRTRDNYMHNILGLSTSEGEAWKNVRRFAIRRLRDGGMGKSSMESIITEEAEALVEDFQKHVGEAIELPWSINTSILNVVWRLVGGHRYDIHDEKIQHLCNNLNDMMAISQQKFFLFDMITWLPKIVPNWIMNYFGKKEFEEKAEVVYEQLHKAIEYHRKTLDIDNPRDLIDSYLIDLQHYENNSPNKSDQSSTFSERELVQSMFDLFIAGSETTSSTVRWLIFYMAKYPEIQKRIQQEIDKVIQNKTVSLDDRDKLPYLESCIHETLRLKLIFPFGLMHIASEDTQIRNYLIPKDTRVMANLIYCHMNPEFWEKPNEFYPEHFMNTDGTFNQKKEGFIPFSTGRRVCIGENLARMDLYIILATLLQKFTFTPPEGEKFVDNFRTNQPFFTFPKRFKIVINNRI